MQRMQTIAAATTLGLALAACRGGAGVPSSGSTIPAAPNSVTASNAISPSNAVAASNAIPDVRGGPGRTNAELAIAALNAAGGPLKTLSDENTDEAPPKTAPKIGECHHGVERFVPDRAGDPDSQESIFYFDAACTHVARDAVRTYVSTGASSETATITVKNYLPRQSTPHSIRIATAKLANATFGPNGYPIVADGFSRSTSSQLTVGASRKVVAAGSEIVVEPAATSVNAFCTDAAAYNTVGVASLDKTFGWSGSILSGGSRTINADGSITWSGTHTGTTVDGAIGSLSLVTGTPNTACPIATPAYSIAGGTLLATSSTAIKVTFDQGTIEALSIVGSAKGGYSLTLASNPKVWPADPNYITGTVTHAGATITTIAVNAFGDGTVTIGKHGLTLVVVDWNVIR